MPKKFGSIRPARGGQFRGRYRLEGKDYYTPTRYSRELVRRDLDLVAAQIRAGVWINPHAQALENPTATINQWWEEWTAERERYMTPNTMRAYRGIWKKHILPIIGNMAWKQVTRQHCMVILDKPELSPLTRQNIHRGLSAGITRAIADGLMSESPLPPFGRKAKRRHEPVALNEKQLGDLISAAVPEFRAAIALMSWCGGR